LVGPPRSDARPSGVLAVRPEHMSLSPDQPNEEANGVAASVASRSYRGGVTRLGLVTRGGSRLSVTLPSESAQRAFAGNSELWVTWPWSKGFLLPEEASEQLTART